MWERMAFNGLFTLLFGMGFRYLTRNQAEITIKCIRSGALTCAIIWLLCLFGEVAIPPLKLIRMQFQEIHWIAGKLVLGLLALPVGFPTAYILTRRRLQRREAQNPTEGQERENDSPEEQAAAKIAVKARDIQFLYHFVLGIGIWAWMWFLSPIPEWVECGEDMFTQTMALFLVLIVLGLLLGIWGGRIVYTLAVRHLSRKG